MYIYIYVCICVCICIFIYIYLYTYIYTYIKSPGLHGCQLSLQMTFSENDFLSGKDIPDLTFISHYSFDISHHLTIWIKQSLLRLLLLFLNYLNYLHSSHFPTPSFLLPVSPPTIPHSILSFHWLQEDVFHPRSSPSLGVKALKD